MAMTSSSANLPDPRVTALETARAMYPDGTVADHITVAEYLLRVTPAAVPAPVRYDYPGGWYHHPLKITCDTRPPYLAVDAAPGGYVVASGGSGGGAGSASVFTIAPRGRDDDGTAGVPAMVG